ncbi:hypothetical protein ILUMI_16612 [Ignelater luminosus]|uniref:Phospholipase A2-like domain-containing protein n=1 Tax=Ignelater luminosus TaxID=2038154 RepID=A0A8K0G8D2_IGNLU|nr:hypothetical protein ILUMI_16612 [Ignelater luminosus]
MPQRYNKSISCHRGTGLVNSLINKLPFELHLPRGYQFCGPGTKLKQRLARGDKGINKLDQSCRLHDIAYANHSDLKERHKADTRNGLRQLGKRKLDLSKASRVAFKALGKMKKKTIKTPRVITVPKTGGILPLIPIFAGLSALGALSGGAAGIAKAVKDA